MADGEKLQFTRVDSVEIKVLARGAKSSTLGSVPRHASGIDHRVLRKAGNKNFGLVYIGDKLALARRTDSTVTLDVKINSKVLYVESVAKLGRHSAFDANNTALNVHA